MASTSIPVPSIDATGCHLPAFADILSGVQAGYKGIYGQDINLDNSTQDAQWLALIALAFNDYAAAFLQAYNAYSPATAQGTGLSSIVKTNGIAREAASYSTCDLTIIGQAGRILTDAIAGDPNGNSWALPTPLTIPLSGSLVATATCLTIGAVSAAAGTITSIKTPQRGWQSVNNAGAATEGAPVETDPQIRVRDFQSTMLPSQTVLDGIIGAIAALPNVERYRAYENDTNVTDTNGIPGHTLSFIVDGGDATQICQVIASKKTPGAGTFGSVSETITDAYGIPRQIRFYRPVEPVITYLVSIKAFSGFTTDTQASIAQAMSDWTNAIGIGNNVLLTRAYAPALLPGSTASTLFEITGLQMARDGAVPQAADIAIAFNEAPFCLPEYVNFAVTR